MSVSEYCGLHSMPPPSTMSHAQCRALQHVQAAQQRYQQQGTAQGTAQLQQQHLPRQQQPNLQSHSQQQPHSQQHLNGAQQPRQQPNLQSLLSIQGGYSAPAPDSRKRKAEDEHSALFSLLPDSTPSVPGSSAPSIPQQVRLTCLLIQTLMLMNVQLSSVAPLLPFYHTVTNDTALLSLLRMSGPIAPASTARAEHSAYICVC